jgi:type VI protein secretion system component VasK
MDILLLVLVCCLYFLPGIFAHVRNHASMGGIWLLNIFLGWTGLGWLIALIWAFSGRHPSRQEEREDRAEKRAERKAKLAQRRAG